MAGVSAHTSPGSGALLVVHLWWEHAAFRARIISTTDVAAAGATRVAASEQEVIEAVTAWLAESRPR
ncbi:hypothetical protein AB0L65_59465 [Nonomuraea sp. NPDC052116]|uniref:hypothetical protein n=1 Tax=Nonomuraea TaxID=83681 RepID=UPI0034025111